MVIRNGEYESTIRECWIEGRWLPYSMCSKNFYSYPKVENKTYLGDSDKCRINGIVQSSREIYHYWQRG